MAEEKFEEALLKLEEIVRKLETGDLTLEDSIKAFEDGIKLCAACGKKLDEAERRVEVLLKTEQGLTTQPFEGETNDG